MMLSVQLNHLHQRLENRSTHTVDFLRLDASTGVYEIILRLIHSDIVEFKFKVINKMRVDIYGLTGQRQGSHPTKSLTKTLNVSRRNRRPFSQEREPTVSILQIPRKQRASNTEK
jgi:hypothetical protein